jgi:nitrous oxidase accessory protein NosD
MHKLRILLLVIVACGLTRNATHAFAEEIKLDHAATIDKTTIVAPGTYRIADASGDGAIHIKGNDLVVDFQGAELDGSLPGQTPEEFSGTGIVLEGRNITLKNAKVRGYKVAIHAKNCLGLVIEDTDISGNYQKHLLSTPEAEDESDWIFGHQNDEHEWLANYGMGLYIEKSDDVTVRRVKARHGQNGIGIDRVNRSKFYDNDCSFLSSWGFAMWRSDQNVITRNAFDFCIRGYSHGVYNRGQDSAGIFMFEQNHGNIIAENSVTHGGDGFFGFAGLEALGDNKAPADFDYHRAGNNDNLLIGNDFSYASAHGIEMTFGFGNRYIDNRVVGNCICGVWGGLSQDTLIAGNRFEDNGEMGYGLERGGVNIDSGRNNRIVGNVFRNNRCGVHLWGPPSADFMKKPWAIANRPASEDNIIAGNTFDGDQIALHLRGKNENTLFADNEIKNINKVLEISGESQVIRKADEKVEWKRPQYPIYGETKPVGARRQLAGRQNIIMTEWGPYDFSQPEVYPVRLTGSDKATFKVLGPSGEFSLGKTEGNVEILPHGGTLPATVTVTATKPGLNAFAVEVLVGDKKMNVSGTLLSAKWEVKFYRWDAKEDPREKEDNWTKITSRPPVDTMTVETIDFKWGSGAPSAKVGPDHFATTATVGIALPAGKYRIHTVSDDGIRVLVDGKKVIDDWTWHPPKSNDAELDLSEGEHPIRIEHFEIDGAAQLQFRIEPVR